MGEYRLRIDTSKDRAVEFVERLAEDDEFRARLESDPRGVLWDYGAEVPDELIPPEITLPSKEEVKAMLAKGPEGLEDLRAGPRLIFPIFVCFFVFPFLTGEGGGGGGSGAEAA